MGVHRGWPGGVRTRISRLSNQDPQACIKLLDRYALANAHPFTMDRLRDVNCTKNPSRQEQKHATIALRYHPVFRLAASRTIALVPLPPEYGWKLRIGWANALPSLDSIVNNVNRRREIVSPLG